MADKSSKKTWPVKAIFWTAIGTILFVIIGGSFWPGYSFETTVQRRLAEQEKTLLVEYLAPICAEKFRARSDFAAKLAALKEKSLWERDQFMVDGKYVISTTSRSVDKAIGGKCAELINSQG